MTNRPKLIYVMILIQIILIIFDLYSPFITGEFLTYSIFEFLMAYMMGFLDFMLIIGFIKGSRWAWLFGIAYSGINVLYYTFAFISNPIMLYLILFIMRLMIIFMLRATRRYFQI
ncbi:MAG: hypothetical protein QXW62_06415 [Candidatus Methanomethylicaceae archaeon]|nr:hypothetical protein [Candidatus Verstraetearchaeota archaeon]